jgi:hypothetical protein
VEVRGSHLGPEPDIVTEVFLRLFQSVQTNDGIVAQSRPQPLPSTSFPIHDSLTEPR